MTFVLLSIAAEEADRAFRLERAFADLLAAVVHGDDVDENFWLSRIQDTENLCAEAGPRGYFEPCCFYLDHGGDHHFGPRAPQISQREYIMSRSLQGSLTA